MSVRNYGHNEVCNTAFETKQYADGASPKRYIRPKEAAKKLGIGLSTLWLKIKNDPDFPKPFKLGPNTTVLVEDQIDHYVSTRSHHVR
jgi:prophage regulatory protein